MGLYTLTTLHPDSRSPMLRGRDLASVTATETSSWQAVALGVGIPVTGAVLVVAAQAADLYVRIGVAMGGGDPVAGYLIKAGSSMALGVAPGDVVNARTA